MNRGSETQLQVVENLNKLMVNIGVPLTIIVYSFRFFTLGVIRHAYDINLHVGVQYSFKFISLLLRQLVSTDDLVEHTCISQVTLSVRGPTLDVRF